MHRTHTRTHIHATRCVLFSRECSGLSLCFVFLSSQIDYRSQVCVKLKRHILRSKASHPVNRASQFLLPLRKLELSPHSVTQSPHRHRTPTRLIAPAPQLTLLQENQDTFCHKTHPVRAFCLVKECRLCCVLSHSTSVLKLVRTNGTEEEVTSHKTESLDLCTDYEKRCSRLL